MSRSEDLNNILEKLRASSSDIEACAVVSEDGLMIASLLPQGHEEGPRDSIDNDKPYRFVGE